MPPLGATPTSSAIPSPTQWLVEGGAEVDLICLAGWRSRANVARYGASAADAAPVDSPLFSPLGTTCRFLRRHPRRPVPEEPGGGVSADINQSRSSVRRSGSSSSEAILR